jgi:peptide/nickel transport system substrate-binding protein
LYLESWEPPVTFNPLNPNATSFLPYLEPLFVFDSYHFKLIPWLAESGTWIDNVTYRVKLRDGAKWSDGQAVTAADVDYTFRLPLRRPEVTGITMDLWSYLNKTVVVDSSTIDFVLKGTNSNQYILMETLVDTYILPEHVWSAEEKLYSDITQFTNLQNPIGSGPYSLMYVSDENTTVWVRNENYWGIPYFGLLQPRYIVNVLSTDNDATNELLRNGEIDWSENFMPNMWEMWQTERLARGSWSNEAPYYMPVPYATGYISFSYTKIRAGDPLRNSEVRRAMAFAIDWDALCASAFSNLATPANPSLLPETVPDVAKYINWEAVQQYGWYYNVTEANTILDSLGYTRDAEGWRHYENGTKLASYELLTVAGWTDWDAAAAMIRQDLVNIGLNVTISTVDEATYNEDVAYGNYTMTFDEPQTWSPAYPWYNYFIIYDSQPSPAANNPQPAYGNWGSYNNTRVDALLNEIAATRPEDENTLSNLYDELQVILLRDLPYIPGWFYGPFYVYSTAYWTNWPTSNNPYSGGVPYWDEGRGWYPMLFELKPSESTITSTGNLNTTTTTLPQQSMNQEITFLQSALYLTTSVAVIASAVSVALIWRIRQIKSKS